MWKSGFFKSGYWLAKYYGRAGSTPPVGGADQINIQIGYIVNMGNQGPTIGGM